MPTLILITDLNDIIKAIEAGGKRGLEAIDRDPNAEPVSREYFLLKEIIDSEFSGQS